MKDIKNSISLDELLDALRDEEHPLFINLCTRCGQEHHLMDEVVGKVRAAYGAPLGFEKLPQAISANIKTALKLTKNPVLLLILRGEIKAIFAGMVPQYKLEAALQNLEQHPNRENAA